MAKNSIRDYANTAASNTDVQSINIDEGCAPSGINNAIREVMADLADVNDGTVALETPVADSFSTDTINEKTSAAGVTIDGVLLKDSEVTTDTINEQTSDTGVTIDGVLLKDSKLNGSYITDATIDADSLASNAVTTAKIANDAVTTDKLAHVNSNTGTKGGGTKSVSLTTNAQGQVTAVSEAGIGWEYLGGVSGGSGSFSSTFVTTGNAYRTIKILFDFQSGNERTYTIQAATTSSYRTLISFTGDVDGTELNGSLVIHNFNNAESPTFKIADANYRAFQEDSDADFGSSSTSRVEGPIIYSYNEAWDNIRVTGTGGASYKAYAFGMR